MFISNILARAYGSVNCRAMVVNISGRGDKDCAEAAEVLEREGL